jgi:serine/threonine protein kinase
MRSTFIGKVIDNYRILESLGIGGMGVVFKAINIKIDKLVALKMIAPGMAMNEKFIRRFQSEAKALAKLADPNIVSIYDLRSDNDQYFIVMEYVNGKNISDIIRLKGAFPIPQSVYILKQILTAVGHAHKSGIIHRDLKPNNIMLTKENMVKITDFGLAKIQSDIINTMTVSGGGTLYYMPPEQVKDFSQTDKRSDIYSIGMTLFEMVTGKVPFENIDSDFDIRETIVHKELNKPSLYKPDIPKELENIILKAIAKDPDDRYQTSDDMLRDLISFETSMPVQETVTHEPQAADVGQDNTDDETYASFGGEKKSPLLKISVAALLLTFLIAAVFLLKDKFFAKKINNDLKSEISITSSPPQANLLIEGKVVGKTPLTSLPVKTGQQYSLSISKNGYKRLDTVFTANINGENNFSFTLKPLNNENNKKTVQPISVKKQNNNLTANNFASLSVNSVPKGAEVTINGESKGVTPLQLNELAAGSYNINIKSDGYETYQNNILLKKGASKKIEIPLSPLTGNLAISTEPSGALIRVDNKALNSLAPTTVNEIPAGKHIIEISKNGYAAYISEINITPGQTKSLNITLNPAFGLLNILVKPWGSIYIDNQLKKESASFVNKFELSAGKHLLKITHPSLGYWQNEIIVENDKTKKIEIDFSRKYKINISAEDKNGRPVSGIIFIDGKDSGEITPKQIELNSGIHHIIVKKEGYVAAKGEKEILIVNHSKEPLMFILTPIASNL